LQATTGKPRLQELLCHPHGYRLMYSPHKAIADKYAGTVEKTAGGQMKWTGG
jgi:hypothetical protein